MKQDFVVLARFILLKTRTKGRQAFVNKVLNLRFLKRQGIVPQ